MPPVIDTGLTVGEILLEMAVRYGIAEEDTAGGPLSLPASNTENFRMLLSALNRGYSRFLNRREWSFLSRPLQILMDPNGIGPLNVDGDPARYRLPEWACIMPEGGGGWKYVDTLSAYGEVMPMPYEDVYSLLQSAGTSSTGTPMYAGIGPYTAGGGHARSVGGNGLGMSDTDWELVLYPSPTAAYLIRATFNMRSHKLVSVNQRHIAGSQNDEAITAEGIWALYESDVMNPERDGAKEARDEAVGLAIARDVKKTLGMKGQITDPATGGMAMPRLNSSGLFVNGVEMVLE